MKERPILFSGAMVRALLAGTKTQTRRVVKLQPRGSADIGHYGRGMPFIRNPDPLHSNAECPYGQPGDRLWVRETWCPANSDNGPVLLFAADHHRRYLVDESYPVNYSRFPAGRRAWAAWAADVEGGTSNGWHPSIHMPRWACRLELEITDVRVERLQAISREDARAEGIPAEELFLAEEYAPTPFRDLWSSINGQASWDENPWVWVVSFRRIEA